jgi:hypothetical protein
MAARLPVAAAAPLPHRHVIAGNSSPSHAASNFIDSLSLDEAVLALRRQQQLLDQERVLATRSMHRLPSGTDLTALLQLQNHRVHQLLLGQAIAPPRTAPSSSLDLIPLNDLFAP